MIGKVNEVILNSLKNYNTDFETLTLKNNILFFNDKSLDLKEFSLNFLFDSYQLKLDLQNITSNTLFEIIKVNFVLFNGNILQNFQNLLQEGKVTEELINFLKFMTKDVHNYQFYLSNDNFKIYEEFRRICYNIDSLNFKDLNEAQRKTLEYFQLSAQELPNFTNTNNNNDDSGVTRKYSPNGFVSALLIVGGAIGLGLMIASVFLVQI